MATQLLPPRRDSIPDVKCSTCGEPVPLAALGDHVCRPRFTGPAAAPLRAHSQSPRFRVPPTPSPPPVTLVAPQPRQVAQSPIIRAPSHAPPQQIVRAPNLPQPVYHPPRDHQLPFQQQQQQQQLPFQQPQLPFQQHASQPIYQPPPSPQLPDTQTGGTAGMAGVGRRAFAGALPIGNGMDGRRANAPQFLAIDPRPPISTPLASPFGYPQSAPSGHSHSAPHSPWSAPPRSPLLPPTPRSLSSRAPSPSGPSNHATRHQQPHAPSAPPTAVPATKLAFADRFRQLSTAKQAQTPVVREPARDYSQDSVPLSPTTPSSGSEPRLPWGDSPERTKNDARAPVTKPLNITRHRDRSESSAPAMRWNGNDREHVVFPSVSPHNDTLRGRGGAAGPSPPNTARPEHDARAAAHRRPSEALPPASSARMGSRPRSASTSASTYSTYSRTTDMSPMLAKIPLPDASPPDHEPVLAMEAVLGITRTRTRSGSRAAAQRSASKRSNDTSFTDSSLTRSFDTSITDSSMQRSLPERTVTFPTRSRTDPQLASSDRSLSAGAAGATRSASAVTAATSRKKREKANAAVDCSQCGKLIDDGRCVQTDGGAGVLCEACWKTLYLPKCRRCDLPIEKQAVSSSDGQLKGKYHRDCFNCHTCHEPFPDASFYVFDGTPFCAYHYHQANNSLCALRTCGRPIEGPCTQAHGGARFHAACLRCQWGIGPSACDARLEGEYWEMDGRMLCSRHAAQMERDERRGVPPLPAHGAALAAAHNRAQRRQTRIFDLAGSAVGPGR